MIAMMKGSKVWGGRIGFVVVLGLSVSAWADEAPNTKAPVAPTSSPKAQADALYNEGMEAAALKRWEAAAEAFKKSFELDPSMNTIMQWGRVLVENEQYVEGATKLQRFLREAKEAPEGLTKGVQGLLRDAKRKVATVQVKIDPADAVISIDGKKIEADEASGPIYLERGSHTFTAEKKGFVMTPVTKTYAAGADAGTLELKMEAAPESAEGPELGPTGPAVKPKKPMKAMIGLGIGVSAVLGVTAVATGISAGVEYRRMQDAYHRRECDLDCDANVQKHGPMYQGLWVTSAIATGLALGAGLVTWRFSQSTANQEKPKVSWNLTPVPGGIVLGGNW